MSNVLSGDHDSLYNFVNFFANLTSTSGTINSSSSNDASSGFADLFKSLLSGASVSSTSTSTSSASTNVTNNDTAKPVAAAASTAKKAETTKSVSLNDPNAAFVAMGGMVTVTIQHSASDYNNRIYWSTDNFKTRHYIGVDNQVGTHNIGVFPAGTRIEFGIDNGAGGFFRTGTAAKNSDGVVHALVSKSKGTSTIRFEDMYGGGDRNYADAIIRVQNKPLPTPKPSSGGDSSSSTTTAITNNNNVDTTHLGSWWPILDPSSGATTIDPWLWLTSLLNSGGSSDSSKKNSDLLSLLTQIVNKKQSGVDSTQTDNSTASSKKDDISSVDVKWLAALNKT